MEKSGLKAVRALIALGRPPKRHGSWTLPLAIFSTLITVGLVALYLMQATTELP